MALLSGIMIPISNAHVSLKSSFSVAFIPRLMVWWNGNLYFHFFLTDYLLHVFCKSSTIYAFTDSQTNILQRTIKALWCICRCQTKYIPYLEFYYILCNIALIRRIKQYIYISPFGNTMITLGPRASNLFLG